MTDQIRPANQLVERTTQLPAQMPRHARRGSRQNQQRQNTRDGDYAHRSLGEETIPASLLHRGSQLPFVRIDCPFLGRGEGCLTRRRDRSFTTSRHAVPRRPPRHEGQDGAHRSTP